MLTSLRYHTKLVRSCSDMKSAFCSVFILNRPPTWSVHRGLHTSLAFCKKRKSPEEKKAPRIIKYSVKSKWKTGEVVEVWRDMTVKELAQQLGKDVNHVLAVMEFVNDSARYTKGSSIIDNFKVVEEVVKKSGMRYKVRQRPGEEQSKTKVKDVVRRDRSKFTNTAPRPPVVTIMGHVDHGKTTLLDKLRHSNVVQSEFGGITQHIGAFSVAINDKDKVTFLDTPGHAAFCAMRNRGAQCTDIVVLVVAADDGVMEQTIESIRMAQEARVPIIVAVNKIDKPGADVDAAKRALVPHGIQVEDLGGEVQVVEVSALKGTNLDLLVEAILVQSELMGLKTDPGGWVEATVVEAWTDSYRGRLCTLLVECGTLRRGDVLVCGTAWCKVRAMFDDRGDVLHEAPPSSPVQVLGWRELPSPGEPALQVESEKRANEVTEWRKAQRLLAKLEEDLPEIQAKAEEHYKAYRAQLEAKRLLGRFRLRPEGPRQKEADPHAGGPPRLSVIVKADVDGSVEAVLDVLDGYRGQMCKLDVVHYGVGPVTPNDIALAQTFSSVIYAFNTGCLEDAQGVPIRKHNVIYKLIEEVKRDMNKLLPPKDVEEVVGEANVLQEFVVTDGKGKVAVAGCRCYKGSLKREALYKLLRRGEVLYSGPAASLRHLKAEVDTIKKDLECGLRLADPSVSFQPGDVLQCFVVNKVPQEVDWDLGF